MERMFEKMDRALFKIKIDDKVKYEEIINVFDGFEFMYCKQEIFFDFKEKEVGLSKNKRFCV